MASIRDVVMVSRPPRKPAVRPQRGKAQAVEDQGGDATASAPPAGRRDAARAAGVVRRTSGAPTAQPTRTPAELAAALAELQAYHEDLLASLQDGVIILDPDGQIVSMNPAAEELTGFSRSHGTGRPLGEIFPAPSPLAALAAKTVAMGRSHADFDAYVVRSDGTRVTVSAVVSLVNDPTGRNRGIVLVLRDASRVRDMEEQFRRSDRLAALGVLAAGVAHEVRNPLVGIRAAAQLMEREAAFPPSLREFTGIIIRQVDRLNRIVSELLSFAGQQPLEQRPCNINQILEEALRLLESALEGARIGVIRRYDPEVPALIGDPDRLLQVFLNLARNGVEAMASGGELTVRTRFERVAPQCGGRAAAVAEITDRGSGIRPEVQRHLFNPFFTTKDGGTGLGLPISVRIVEEHGGTIEVVSRVGEGSTFRVLLPLAGDKEGART
jgi:two-component system, NtrC family, nitrogen regulation sensor histidine kinase GlnL